LKLKKWQKALKRNSCTKKRKYDTKEEAELNGKIYKQTVYKCWYCEGYHLTHMPADKFKEYMDRIIIERKLNGKLKKAK
jgi:hypothetical protein